MSRSREHRERSVESQPNHFVDFLLWLSMVKLKFDHDTRAYDQLQTYLEPNPHKPIVYSIAPHTGHTDSLFVYKAIEKLAPQQLETLVFVSAKDTWSNPLKRAVAQMVIGDPYLFDRDNADSQVIREQIREMQQLLNPNAEKLTSLAIYPQGTRTIGAKIHDMPLLVSSVHQAPIAVFSIEGAASVFPKLEGREQASHYIQMLTRRLRSRRSDKTTVTVRLEDFIDPKTAVDPENEHTPKRKVIKRRFYAAHGVEE